MKSPYFSEDHQLFRQSVRQFFEREVIPHINDWEAQERIPKAIWPKLGEMGLLGLDHEEAYGGSAADFFYSVVMLEELARCESGGFSAAVSVHAYMATAHLSKAGSDYLKKKYLAPAISGQMVGALAISEPGAGSDVAALRTTAVREGDHYVINGQKVFITNGVYSDFIVVACKTQPDAGVNGISLIVVDRNTPGLSANKLKKIGWHCSDTGEIFLENVRVPATNLIGEENQGFFYIMDSFQVERLVGGVMANAGSEWALEVTRKYMNEREAFGRPIKKYQVLRHRFVNLATELEASKQLAYHACWLVDQKQYAVKEASMVKLYASELANKVATECLQFFGGYGYMEDFPVARLFRDSRVGTIAGGTSEIMGEILSKMLIDDVSYDTGYKPLGTDAASREKAPETAREIIESIPRRFRPEKVNGYEGVFHFEIKGDRGGSWTVEIREGACRLSEGLLGKAACVVRAKDQTYEDLELGRINPQMALMTGKVKVSDVMEMMKFTKFFYRVRVD